MNKMKQNYSVISALVIGSIVLLPLNQVVNGQNSSSMVDKLIEDTKRDIITTESYRAELVNTIQNSTCLVDGYSGNFTYLVHTMTIEQLENQLKKCVARGIIK